MNLILWAGLAQADETDCVTKDGAWRWWSTTAGPSAGDRWTHGSEVVVHQAPGASGRLTWHPDEGSKVPFQKQQTGDTTVETFRWNVELASTDGKPIAAGVADTRVTLTLHCQRTTGGSAPPAAPAKAAPAPAVTAAPATPATPAAPAAAAPTAPPAAAKPEAPKAEPPKTPGS